MVDCIRYYSLTLWHNNNENRHVGFLPWYWVPVLYCRMDRHKKARPRHVRAGRYFGRTLGVKRPRPGDGASSSRTLAAKPLLNSLVSRQASFTGIVFDPQKALKFYLPSMSYFALEYV